MAKLSCTKWIAVGFALLSMWNPLHPKPASALAVGPHHVASDPEFYPAIGRPQGGSRHNKASLRSDYFVAPGGSDANDGSAAHPWRTIQRAANIVKPGDTVHVAPGEYMGPVLTTHGGTSAEPIRFVSDTKWAARITFASSKAVSGWENRADHIEIVGFDVTGRGGDGTVGIDQEGSFSRVINCRVHDITLPAATNGGAGIDNSNYATQNDDIIGNVVFNIVGTTSPKSVQGIYHSVRGGHIWNNISYRNSGWGIHLWHAATGTPSEPLYVSNNLVFANGEGGIVIGSGDFSGGSIDYVTVANNIVRDNPVGIAEETDGINSIGLHNLYLNNLFYKNRNPTSLSRWSFVAGSINADPLFVNYQPDGSGDYHLGPGSPCIGHGDPRGAPTYALDQSLRPHGANPNIGPY